MLVYLGSGLDQSPYSRLSKKVGRHFALLVNDFIPSFYRTFRDRRSLVRLFFSEAVGAGAISVVKLGEASGEFVVPKSALP